jgi:hypothetical protein
MYFCTPAGYFGQLLIGGGLSASEIRECTAAYRKRSLAPIDLRTTDACDGVSFCG